MQAPHVTIVRVTILLWGRSRPIMPPVMDGQGGTDYQAIAGTILFKTTKRFKAITIPILRNGAITNNTNSG